MKKTSMVRRLVIGFGGSFVGLSLISGLALYFLLLSQLNDGRSAIVRDRLETIQNLLKSPDQGLQVLRTRVQVEWPLRGGEKVYLQIIDGDGNTVVQTPNLPATFMEGPGGQILQTTYLQNSIGLKNPVKVRLEVGGEQAKDFLKTLREVLLAVFLFNMGTSLFVGWWLVSRETRSLNWMTSQVARIDSENLRERIRVDRLPSEIQSLAQSFNHTLDRLADSFERLSRFSADLAHELRTPISNIMGSIEVALSKPRTEAEYRELLVSSLEECARISRLTESLLFLARAENMQRNLKVQTLDLSAEIDSIIEFYEPLATDKGVRLIRDPKTEVNLQLAAEGALFQMALGNLISNAIRYSRSGSEVTVTYQQDREWLTLSVIDQGQGIPASDLPKIFERFYRVDPSRHHSSGGTGLGLTIVKGILDLHQGSISAESILGQGSRFIMKWPNPRA